VPDVCVYYNNILVLQVEVHSSPGDAYFMHHKEMHHWPSSPTPSLSCDKSRHQKLHWVLLSQATLLVSIPVSSIMTANKEMKQVVDSTAGRNSPVLTSKCETYDHFTPKEKEQIQ